MELYYTILYYYIYILPVLLFELNNHQHMFLDAYIVFFGNEDLSQFSMLFYIFVLIFPIHQQYNR